MMQRLTKLCDVDAGSVQRRGTSGPEIGYEVAAETENDLGEARRATETFFFAEQDELGRVLVKHGSKIEGACSRPPQSVC